MLKRFLKTSKNKNQKGVVLIFMAFVISFVILPLTGLVIDLGRIIITLRQAQNLADMSATAGVQYLGKLCMFNQLLDCNNVNNWATQDGWSSVKPAIRALALKLPISGVSKFTSTNYFTTGSFDTQHDLPNYQKEEMSNADSDASITIRVRRASHCYNGTSWQTYYLDDIPNAYCLANAVEATVTIQNYQSFFAAFIGDALVGPKSRTGTAHLRWVPNACGQPSCTLIEQALALPTPCS